MQLTQLLPVSLLLLPSTWVEFLLYSLYTLEFSQIIIINNISGTNKNSRQSNSWMPCEIMSYGLFKNASRVFISGKMIFIWKCCGQWIWCLLSAREYLCISLQKPDPLNAMEMQQWLVFALLSYNALSTV
jgi:hypothetical protein